ncbi:hypothetical protein EJ03DRAFT_213416 [Teratosphaeria nubilosa]|uniref:BTB domain-containing protein n=1 Tax=Teratosphaeria nubilosa TaxID=161662 RepID=A0A6G1LGP8_9PEZI|nr:hypothetical protein EJ03DRAFT_213416 [Teratosphaeria nubilosa]
MDRTKQAIATIMSATALPNGTKELLDTGYFSDLVLQGEDRTWKVHKNILCTRSDFFISASSICARTIQKLSRQCLTSFIKAATSFLVSTFFGFPMASTTCTFHFKVSTFGGFLPVAEPPSPKEEQDKRQ